MTEFPWDANEPSLPPEPLAPAAEATVDDDRATAWVIVLLAVSLLLMLFIMAALVATRPV